MSLLCPSYRWPHIFCNQIPWFFPDFSLLWFDFPWLKTLILSQWPLLLEVIYWFKCCQNIQHTSTPPLSKIRSAGILSIWQKETTSSHIWTAIKFEYFDLTKIRFFEIHWFSAKFQISWFFPAGIFFFTIFPVFQSAWPPCSYVYP